MPRRGQRWLGAGVIGGLFLVLLLLNLWLNPARFAPSGFLTTIGLLAPMLLAALATAPAILSGGGGIDISIGPMIGLLNVAMVQYLFLSGIESPFLVLPIVLLAGAALGALNGLLVVVVRLPPIVATLGAYLVFVGLSPWVMNRPGGSVPDWLPRLAHDLSPLLLVMVGVLWFLLVRTPFHRYLMATGGSAKAAYASGVDVARVRIIAYALGGLFAGAAALALTALLGSGDPNIGPPITLKAIAAVALGGVSLAGGRGGLIGAATGALIIYQLDLVLTRTGLSTFVLQMIYGVVLVAAVVFNAVVARRR
ncbi:MAG: ABC transporter permease [Chloroflexi bacterium]|nr:ABC transporter permease [Chloroflexota bacterium]